MNKKARTAATSLGLTILLTVLWIYLPMPILLAAPTDVVALNVFFDTLLFCGAILLLANSIARNQLWHGFRAPVNINFSVVAVYQAFYLECGGSTTLNVRQTLRPLKRAR